MWEKKADIVDKLKLLRTFNKANKLFRIEQSKKHGNNKRREHKAQDFPYPIIQRKIGRHDNQNQANSYEA